MTCRIGSIPACAGNPVAETPQKSAFTTGTARALAGAVFLAILLEIASTPAARAQSPAVSLPLQNVSLSELL